MKLSIITPIYRSINGLEIFLKKMEKQTNINYEIILIIDTNNEDALGLIDKYLNTKMFDRIKLIFNSKRTSRTNAITQGIKIAQGEYSIIYSIFNKINETMVDDIIEVAKKRKTDIIEFKPKITNPIKFESRHRKIHNKSVVLNRESTVFCTIHPFDYNKIFKTSILFKSLKIKTENNRNSRFSIEFVYKALFVAKTFSTHNKSIISLDTKIPPTFNPVGLITQWDPIIKFASDKIDIQLLQYAQFFSEVVFLSSLTKASKNKKLISRFNDKVEKQLENGFKNILTNNKYANLVKGEREILYRNLSVEKQYKNHKELGE